MRFFDLKISDILSSILFWSSTISMLCLINLVYFRELWSTQYSEKLIGGAFLITVFESVKHIDKISRNRQFRAIFGEGVFFDTIHLVYPNFCLSEEADKRLEGMNRQLVFQKMKPTQMCETTHRVDVETIVAENDIKALTMVASMLGLECRYSPVIISDRNVNFKKSYISFGFSSNECTHVYLDKKGLVPFLE